MTLVLGEQRTTGAAHRSPHSYLDERCTARVANCAGRLAHLEDVKLVAPEIPERADLDDLDEHLQEDLVEPRALHDARLGTGEVAAEVVIK